MNLFLAKTKDKKTIIEHTNDLLFYFDAFKKEFKGIIENDLMDIVELSVIYHDIGKVNRRFQNKLYEKLGEPLLPLVANKEEIPHGYLSPSFINYKKIEEKYSSELCNILVASVMLHHSRQKLDNEMKREIKRLVVEELSEDVKNFNYDKAIFFSVNPSYKYFKRMSSVICQNLFLQDDSVNNIIKEYVLVKGVLNKLDYLASGMDQSSCFNYPLNDVKKNESVDKIVIEKIKGDGFELRQIQTELYRNRDKSSIIIASTGLGKTEAALLWLSDQKGIFTLPLKVSIDAIYRRIKYDYKYSSVELVHSSMEDIYLQEQDAVLDYASRVSEAKLFTAPLTVTTIDQVFKFVFKHNGFELMLSILMHSKVVIDEIQMYDSQLIACLIYGIKVIHFYGGKFLIMTATLPKYIKQLLVEQGIPMGELFEKTYLIEESKCSRRHLLKFTGQRLAISEILTQGKEYKVLVIVNTVKKAQELYRELSNEMPIRLLHSNFIKKDRRILEQNIQKFTNDDEQKGNKGVWISTQIVEASLDIDFDILHTEMCSIDSFIQRMGRVYRRRYKLQGNMPNVYVANTKNTGYGKVIDIDMYETSLKVLSQYDGRWISEMDKQNMMSQIFDHKKYPNMKKFKDKVQEKISYFENIGLHQVDKKSIETMFRDIDTKTCIPFNRYHELVRTGTLIELQNIFFNSENFTEKSLAKNKLLDYTLPIRRSSKDWREADEEILKKLNICICDRIYDFDDELEIGEGLTLQLESDDVFL